MVLEKMDHLLEFRRQVLTRFGASSATTAELLTYNTNVFDHSLIAAQSVLPLEDEPFISAWQEYAAEAQQIGGFAALRKRLVQLNFPVTAGISTTEAYQLATKKGIIPEAFCQGPGLALISPEKVEIQIQPTLAGKVPLIITAEKADFVAFLRAIMLKNEPGDVPDSQGAAMIAGYNNWDRVWQLQERFRQANSGLFTEARWAKEFAQIIPQKHLYQDKFILLSQANYSGIPAEQIHCEAAEWQRLSLIIRREHECTHYFTKRALGSMRNNMLDELIADYAGITAAIGYFKAAWFLTFVGLENYPHYREGGRLQNYRGNPPLSDEAFTILQTLVYHAAQNLERCSQLCQSPEGLINLVLPLTYLTLEELASEQAADLLAKHLA
jgi:hypothetical protein